MTTFPEEVQAHLQLIQTLKTVSEDDMFELEAASISKGRTEKSIVIRNIPIQQVVGTTDLMREPDNAYLVAFAMSRLGETPGSIFGHRIDEHIEKDVVTVHLYID